MRLKDKVAIVTGGAQGIGLAIVKRFAEEGATVVIGDINPIGLDRAKAFRREGKNVYFNMLDVTSEESVARFIAAVFQIDILVNNAGIKSDALLEKMSYVQYKKVMEVNAGGVFLMTREVVPYMLAQGSGVILNASSIVAGGNFGQTAYAASKGAVESMTVTWAREFGGRGIRVNAVAPGFTATEMVASMSEKALERVLKTISMKRLATPEEIAHMYAVLASDEASYVNGAIVPVSGACVV